jgi:hypothetical protein
MTARPWTRFSANSHKLFSFYHSRMLFASVPARLSVSYSAVECLTNADRACAAAAAATQDLNDEFTNSQQRLESILTWSPRTAALPGRHPSATQDASESSPLNAVPATEYAL